MLYLSSDDNYLEQLQAQLKRLPALGMIFITRTHEEVFQLPAKSLLFLISPDPVTSSCCGTEMVALVVAMTDTLRVILAAAVR